MSDSLMTLLQLTGKFVFYSSVVAAVHAILISKNRSSAFQYEQKIRTELANFGRSDEADEFLSALKSWQNASWLTQIGSPPYPPVIRPKSKD